MLTRSLMLTMFTSMLLATIGSPTSAAIINWGAVDGTDAIADISTNGTEVAGLIVNAGGGANNTVNGVTFVGAGTGPLGSQGSVLFGTVAGFASGDPIWNMLNSVSFGGGTEVTTLSLAGLSVGRLYEIQIFYVDRNQEARMMRYGDGEGGGLGTNTVDLLASTAGGTRLGQNVIGTFTADGTAQAFTMDPQGFGNSHINIYQVRDISTAPEPSTVILMSLGLLGLAIRRSRRTR